MTRPRTYEPKEKFVDRMNLLLKDKEDSNAFFACARSRPPKSIRVNTLKISPTELKKRLEKYGWKITTFNDHPEIIRIDSELFPGEIGKTKEHLLGYYYVQEITSMMPIIALQPKKEDILLDLCASPGSKTTQAAAIMENSGTIIANDLSIGRISILSANIEKNSVTNTIITRHDGLELCSRLKKMKFFFDKILVDAPCSGEGNIRVSPRTYLEWSVGMLKKLSKKQKKLASSAYELLLPGGMMIYSTCTHAPEENEDVIQYLIENYDDIRILPIEDLPIRSRPGILGWEGEKFDKDMINARRIYHHDNDMEGFFLCKITKDDKHKKDPKE